MIVKSFRIAVLAFPVVALMSTSVSSQELMGAFIFGSRNLDCDIPGSEDKFTMIHHAGNDQASHDAMAYTAEKGYGLVVTDPGNTGRNGSSQFGPFDNSPNNRNEFGDDCPEQIYDSFIGWKNYETDCDAETQGDPNSPCSPAEGGIFRVDVPNGLYRFTLVIGEADNPHAHRVLAESGGDNDVTTIGNHVTLISNYDQAQQTGGPDGGKPGAGVFAVVGFPDAMPPPGDGVDNDPVFVPFGADGNPAAEGEGANSPTLSVTAGYVQIHLLQGNSNNGPGGKNFDEATGIGDRDRNGPDIVLLQLWRVGDNPEVPASTTLGSILLVLCAAGLGVALLIGRKKLAPATA